MAKKKKKNRGKKKTSAPRQHDFLELMLEQKAAFLAGRCRRASVLGERIFQDISVDESMRRRSFAAGHEAHLREMLSKGHVDQVRSKAGKLLKSNDWLADFWALSLQLRLGLEEYRDDRIWLEQLRAELVDPADLCGVESGGLGEQAQRVLDAWALAEKGDGAAALDRLSGVGRRSPLVDWRLFVQGLVALGENDREGAESAVKRMQAACPARAAAEALLARVDERCGFYARRLKGLQGPLKSADYPRLAGLIKHALAEGRPGFALTLATTFGVCIGRQFDADRYFTALERMRAEGFSLKHIYTRMAVVDYPRDAFLRQDTMQDLREPGWSKAELARLWIRFFGQVREKWMTLRQDMMSWELDGAREGLLFPLLADCRWLVQKLPDFREAYLFWDWLELEGETESCNAMQAYAEAFPEDPEVLELAVMRFAEAGEFKKAATWLTRLKRIQKSKEKVEALQQTLLFHRIKEAFDFERDKTVEKLGSGYVGQNPLERIQISFMRWRVASRGDKRKRGVEMAELGSPWLALFYACEYEGGFAVSKLPAAVRRSLENDPDAVLRGYLELLEQDPRRAAEMEDEVLYGALGKALDHSEASVALLRPALCALLVDEADPYEFISASKGAMGAFRTLLKGGADDQALAVALRIRMVYEWIDGSLDEEKAERSLRVAWTLAESGGTRALVSRVNSRTRAVPGRTLKKPATEKMVKAELKMQLKFTDLRQVVDRYSGGYSAPRSFNPFEGAGGIEAVIEDLINGYDSEESCDESWEDDPSYAPPENIIPEPSFQPRSKPYVFSKHTPTMEMEFEGIIKEIRQTTSGMHRKKAAATVGEMIENSAVSEKAKARLREKQRMLMEGE